MENNRWGWGWGWAEERPMLYNQQAPFMALAQPKFDAQMGRSVCCRLTVQGYLL